MKGFSCFGLLFLVAACTSQDNIGDVANQKAQYVDGECYHTGAMQSLTASFDQYMDERNSELKSLQHELSAENYEQLDYALKHFVNYWHQLEQERNQACELHATCQFVWLKSPDLQRDNDFCDGTDFEYSVSRAKLINFFNDIERLQLEKAVP
ncbi:hypothetical protein [Photobacterium ganghwense]|uniref:hypothetical protein n=1 Tax=Photobacterium ganghwense TaxID=320778 RepID=UPI001C2D6878|nr:hypothetical protein [Photobacterium ganghwense]MBV1841149.1 hypothetical protein [Photobacterium ganghwense]